MDLAVFFSFLPREAATLLIAALPLAELRGAIPIALTIYELDVPVAYFFSVVGSILPAIPILWLLGPVSGWMIKRFSWAQKFFDWLFNRTRHRFAGKYEKWGQLALVVFVAIPLPVTGVWTGSVAAFLFGIPKYTALFLISVGSLIAGVIVTLATLGLVSLF